MTSSTLDRRTLIRCVEAATLAPSLHNSQPWRFRIDGDTIEVYADRKRRLEVLDPDARGTDDQPGRGGLHTAGGDPARGLDTHAHHVSRP
jgi:hypothetical protein